jgi:hypothetical protein
MLLPLLPSDPFLFEGIHDLLISLQLVPRFGQLFVPDFVQFGVFLIPLSQLVLVILPQLDKFSLAFF